MNEELSVRNQIDFTKLLDAYPALSLFNPILGATLVRIIDIMLMQGVDPKNLQAIADSDGFIIRFAGSMFSQLQGNPNFGHDGGNDGSR
jgi:hypothetical protein